ncbi:MAG: flippase-like domain-containing protein [Bacteroidetes bacterium]|nr:flippase-like domain-containing protein [Bacteroidota bacterium]
MNKSIKILVNYFLGPVIMVLLCWSLYSQLMQQHDLALRWQQVKQSWYSSEFIIVLVLMLVNWGIEARKWQVLVLHLQPVSLVRAFKSVLAGCSITMLTPNRIGEYGGRILFLKEEHRIKAISLNIVSSISQLLITMIMGCAGLIYLRFFSHNNPNALTVLPDFWGNVLIYFSISGTLLLFLFYIRLGWLVGLMEKLTVFNKIIRHIQVLDEFSASQLLRLLSLSLVRYLVFVLQYLLLLNVMHVDIDHTLNFWLITVFYLVMAVAPTIGFLELPVRAKASIEVMKLFSSNTLGIESAALAIWLINLVIPALIGSILILGIKIVKEK